MVSLGVSEIRELSIQEVEDINGGWVNFAFGAALGDTSYGITSAVSGEFSWGGLTGSTVAGAYSSGFSVLAGGGRVAIGYFGATGAAAGGATSNAVNRYVDLM